MKAFMTALVAFLFATTSFGQSSTTSAIDTQTTIGGWKIVAHNGSVVEAYSRVVTDTVRSGKFSRSFFVRSVEKNDKSSATWEKVFDRTFTKRAGGYFWPYLKKLGSSFPNNDWIYIWLYFGNENGYELVTGLYVPGYIYNVFYPISFSFERAPERFDRIKIEIELRGENITEVILDDLAFDFYSQEIIEGFEDSTITDVEENPEIPTNFTLFQNYPNPFNPETVIRYTLSVIGNVKLTVFNTLGQEVAVLVDEEKLPGSYEVVFNASNLPSGAYFYRLQTKNFVETKKMLLIK